MIMMGPKKGKLASIILGKLGEKSKYEEMKDENAEKMESVVPEVSQDKSHGLDASAEAMLNAFKQQDASALKSSLLSFIKLAMKEEE